MVRIEGVGHHFEQYHQYYCIVVVVLIVAVADNANDSEEKDLLRQKKGWGAHRLHPPLYPPLLSTYQLKVNNFKTER